MEIKTFLVFITEINTYIVSVQARNATYSCRTLYRCVSRNITNYMSYFTQMRE